MKDHLEGLIRAIREYAGPPVRLMEVCGTHTRQIAQFGIRALLPPGISLVSGPGCPVCVTPAGYIDRAAELALRPGCALLSFGDMMRVPGNRTSLLQAKAAGGNVALMYSPMEALERAATEPSRTFYVTAIGFETTLPVYALLVRRMAERGVRNVRLLTAIKAMVPAVRWICEQAPDIHGLIGPGHVSAVLGWGGYEPVCARYGIPIAVAGFGYEHIVAAIVDLLRQTARGASEVHNLYPGVVSREGNTQALSLIGDVFRREASVWRGLGEIEDSGYRLAPAYAEFDAGPFAEESDQSDQSDESEASGCLCGSVVAGRANPVDCPHFGEICTPASPLGPCMVSGEGACGIRYAERK